VNEWIKQSDIYASKCAADWKTFTFETLRSSCNAANCTRTRTSNRFNTWKYGDIGNGYCRHFRLLISAFAFAFALLLLRQG
jgi:hypothetical protein